MEAHAGPLSARVNGPQVSVGVHLGVVGVSAGVRAEACRFEGNVGPVSAAFSPNLNTSASVGLDGAEVTFLGWGAQVGPTVALKTPLVDVSIACTIM